MGKDTFNAYILFFTVMLLITARMIPFQALTSEIISDHSRGKLMCLTIAIGQIGMGLGSATAGFVYSTYGFWANSMVASLAVVLMAFLVWRFIPETNSTLERPSEVTSI